MAGTTFSPANWDGYDEQSVTNPSAALTDFTVLIDVSTLSATFKSTVQSDGADIRVAKGDNTELPYDLIGWAYNAGAPTGIIRAKYSGTMASSGTQNVRVFAGYTPGTAVAYSASETFGSDNAYDSNWYLYLPDGGFGALGDRTSNGNTATGAGGISGGDSTGLLGIAATNYDGVSGSYDLGVDDTLDSLAGFSVSMFADMDGTSGASGLFSDWASSGDGHLLFRLNGSTLQCYINNTTQTGPATQTGPSSSAGFQQFAADYDGSNLIASVDGSDGSGVSTSGTLTTTNTNVLKIGRSPHTSADASDMQACEIQFHTISRAAAWRAHEYLQVTNQASFFGTWAWTAAAGGGTILPQLMMMGVG